MRETWKGMIIGALAGALVGLALEALRSMSSGAKRAAHEASAQAPVVAQAASDLADRATQKLRDADLPDQARDVAQRMGQQVKNAAEAGRSTLSHDD